MEAWMGTAVVTADPTNPAGPTNPADLPTSIIILTPITIPTPITPLAQEKQEEEEQEKEEHEQTYDHHGRFGRKGQGATRVHCGVHAAAETGPANAHPGTLLARGVVGFRRRGMHSLSSSIPLSISGVKKSPTLTFSPRQGVSATGSGKTLCYLLPCVPRILAMPAVAKEAVRPLALIVVPTRELAQQVRSSVVFCCCY
jgi:hypothetical protein